MLTLSPSRYTLQVPLRGGRTLGYNGLSGGLAVWDADETAIFEAISSGAPVDPASRSAQALLHGGYVVPQGVDELALVEEQYLQHRFDTRSLVLTVAPTLSCNFGCDYCFQGQDKPTGTMTPEVQDGLMAMVERFLPSLRRVHVAWYGGEPLLRLKVIEALSDRLIARCAEAGVAYSAMMVSNGYRLTAEVARSLVQRQVKTVQVTLDGGPGDHDRRRALLSGRPTFDRIVTNLQEVIDQTELILSVRVNIDHRNAERIPALLEHLAAAGLGNRGRLGVYFAPVEAMTSGCHTVEDVCMTKTGYGQLEVELLRQAFALGLASLPRPPRFRGTCAAIRPRGYVILPSGDVHKCWDTVSFPERAVGSIFDLDALARGDRMRQWLSWSPLDNAACRSCRILPNCAGSCAYKFVHAEDTRGEAASLPCPSWKYNIKERLLLRAEKSGVIGPEDIPDDVAPTDPAELCVDTVPAAAK
ncbi:MAG: TIGR04463 family radical SAM/SPASM RiPP maturase [Alphaproteobacteria bacterium]|nr:TIGR04463 family radical SAM/SPASM RiPP maturase [Alphaproteobacteria bacterium]